jgi:hypothetical protein
MYKINESREDSTARDGGVIFQAKLSHNITWQIGNGKSVFDQNNINTKLHEVEVFPDLNYKSGKATSVYYILSEVNILKRKFDLASKFIKRQISPSYSAELDANPEKEHELTFKYFDNTRFDVELTTDRITLREISTSGIDSGSPSVVLKLSTGLADMVDGVQDDPWRRFKLRVKGNGVDMVFNQESTVKLSGAQEYDPVENKSDVVFQTIIPSINIKLTGERVNVETFTSRSNNLYHSSNRDIESIFRDDGV